MDKFKNNLYIKAGNKIEEALKDFSREEKIFVLRVQLKKVEWQESKSMVSSM